MHLAPRGQLSGDHDRSALSGPVTYPIERARWIENQLNQRPEKRWLI